MCRHAGEEAHDRLARAARAAVTAGSARLPPPSRPRRAVSRHPVGFHGGIRPVGIQLPHNDHGRLGHLPEVRLGASMVGPRCQREGLGVTGAVEVGHQSFAVLLVVVGAPAGVEPGEDTPSTRLPPRAGPSSPGRAPAEHGTDGAVANPRSHQDTSPETSSGCSAATSTAAPAPSSCRRSTAGPPSSSTKALTSWPSRRRHRRQTWCCYRRALKVRGGDSIAGADDGRREEAVGAPQFARPLAQAARGTGHHNHTARQVRYVS